MEQPAFLSFIKMIVNADIDAVKAALNLRPALATFASTQGASRAESEKYFFKNIEHYLYSGDTAAHMAAAAHSWKVLKLLLKNGADCQAKNRMGAEPLHYACDRHSENTRAQSMIIQTLVTNGANPNAKDKFGVTALHRAVRTRSQTAVRSLLALGANPNLPNGTGSTPLHLAVQSTGASQSGSDKTQRRQRSIIKLLLSTGAQVTDLDAKGRTLLQCAASRPIQEFLKQQAFHD